MIRFNGRIPVIIYPQFWFVVGLLSISFNRSLFSESFSSGLLEIFSWIFIILTSLLVHEFGHALTATYFGYKSQVEIAGFWGVTRRQGPKVSLLKEFFIVLNGPLAGFFLFLIARTALGFFSEEDGSIPKLLRLFADVNYFWTILNLLPVYPLDGGQLMKIVMEFFWGAKALRVATLFSIFFGSVICLLALYIQDFFLAFVFLLLSFEALQTFRSSKDLVEEDTDAKYQLRLNEAIKLYEEKDLDLAIENFVSLRRDLNSGKIYLVASVFLAKIYSTQKEWIAAFEVLKSVELLLDYEGLVLYQEVLFTLKHYEKSLAFGRKSFRMSPHADIAIINAYSAAQLGQVTEAVGWLKYLSSFSEVNFKSILNHETLNNIRSEPSFLRFLNESFHNK
jgi:stage IV sporulation protein FB